MQNGLRICIEIFAFETAQIRIVADVMILINKHKINFNKRWTNYSSRLERCCNLLLSSSILFGWSRCTELFEIKLAFSKNAPTMVRVNSDSISWREVPFVAGLTGIMLMSSEILFNFTLLSERKCSFRLHNWDWIIFLLSSSPFPLWEGLDQITWWLFVIIRIDF